jgi:tetratricopeptide (TPR) repeat protein
VLVVLDNAAAVEQVRPLLPGSPSCAVLVTSRDSLAGLVAAHGAHRLRLDRLPEPDAIALLRRLIGAPVGAQPAAAARLAAQCERLPLALRVAAELAAARAQTPLAELVSELDDLRRRLDLLDAGGDPRAAVRAVLSWSYRHLPADTARTFRLLGLHPGADWDPAAVAALTGHEPWHSRALLDALARAHLIEPAAPGRHGMHDLLRGYAAELAAGTDPAATRQAALTGLLDHYLAGAAAAMDTRYPAEAHRRPRPTPSTPDGTPSTAYGGLSTPDAAQEWLDAERANLIAVAAHAAEHGWPAHAIGLAGTLFRYLDAGGRTSDALALHTHALFAAELTGDAAAQANALTSLGGVHWRQGRYGPAAAHVERALALHRRLGDRAGEARALANLGRVLQRRGELEPAAARLRQALALFTALGDRLGEARTLDHLGFVAARQGLLRQAEAQLRQALALFGALGDRLGEAESLGHLGAVRARQGRYPAAAEDLRQALTRYRDCGHPDGEAYALANLGAVTGRLGDPDAAHQLDQARCLYQRAGDRLGEAQVLVHLSELAAGSGDCGPARGQAVRALELFRAAGDRAGEAEALTALGEALHESGDHAAAADRHAEAAELAGRTGDRYQRSRALDGLARAGHATAGRSGGHPPAGYRESTGPPDAPDTFALLGAPGAGGPSTAV